MTQRPKQPTRRNKGEGSIIKMPNGKYKAVITVPTAGKQIRRSRTVQTKSEAVRALKELHTIYQTRNIGLPTFDSITFAEYTVRFLARKQGNIKTSTYTMYKTMLTKHVCPYIGCIPMRQITTAHINTILLNEHELKPSTRKLLRAVLSAVCNSAYREGMITDNPVRYSDRILGEERKVDLFLPAEEEMNILLTILKKEHYLLYVLVLATIHSGLRKGEIQGLKWTSLDTEKNILRIRTQKNSYGEDISLKTTSSIRDIHINAAVMQTILSLPRTSSYIFPVNAHHYRLLKRYFLAMGFHQRMAFHDLRHYHATLLMKKGVNVKIISKRLGHKDIQTTLNIYTHHEPDMDRQVVDLLGDTHLV